MAEFKLGRIRFVWQGEWNLSTSYVVDDIVTIGGKSYICVRNHTAGVTDGTFAGDLNIPGAPKWELVSDGTEWQGEWTASTYYNEGAQVKYGGIVYVCNTAHTSATNVSPTWLGLENDQSKWDIFATTFNWTGPWATDTKYRVNDFVSYGGVTYVCNTAHISAATSTLGLEDDQASWDIFNKGITYLGDWTDAVRYRENDVVKYGASTWICTTAHTSTTTFDDTKFEIFVEGLEFEDSWSDATTYQIGDVVTYGGYTYTAKRNNLNSNPSTGVNASLDWSLYITGFNFVGDWLSVTDYKVGDVVRVGAYTYLAIEDNTDDVPPSASWNRLNTGVNWTNPQETYTAVAGTTLTGIGESATFDVVRSGTTYSVTVNAGGQYYEVGDTIQILGTAVGGLSPVNDLALTVATETSGVIETVTISGFSSTWTADTVYVLGDIAFWGANSYICVQGHTASTLNRPDNDVDAEFWNLFAAGSESAILTIEGDTYYYGANGPTRLPIGSDGQILRVTSGYPEWAYYGVVNNVVYVAPTGTNSEDTGWGLTIDKPWASVRYACDQVRKGYLNRGATELLKRNKQFLMKEISNWVTYTYSVEVTGATGATDQFTATSTAGLLANMPIEFDGTVGGVTAGTKYYVKTVVDETHFTISTTSAGATFNLADSSSSMNGVLSFDRTYCERDTGLLVEAVIYDLSHGGTSQATKAANAYYTASGSSFINANFGQQTVQTIAAYNYLKDLMVDVLAKATPANNYQSLNGVTEVAVQLKPSDVTAEDGTGTVCDGLLSIVTDGIAAGTPTAIPTAVYSNTTVFVKTGTYFEVLPIIIPNYTAVVGDELRGTVISPNRPIANLVNDKEKSISALNRLRTVASDLVQNNAVVKTTTNPDSQVIISGVEGSVGSTECVDRVVSSANTIYDILANGISLAPNEIMPAPTGQDTDYAGAINQIDNNYTFIKAEISAYLSVNYNSVWTGLGVDGQASCQRDVGYILDALRYDLNYGGNTQSLIVGSSYYSYINLVIASTELTATLAAYAHLKSIIDDITKGITIVKSAGNSETQSISGSKDTTGDAATFAQARVQDIYDWIDDGTAPTAIAPDTAWVNSDLAAAFTAIQAKKTEIQQHGLGYVNKYHQELTFNETTCSRDIGYMVDAIGYDMMFGSNFASTIVGKSYYRAISSTQIVIANQLEASLGLVNFLKYKIKNIAASGAGAWAQMSSVIDDIIGTINGGAVPRFEWPDYEGIDSGYQAARTLISDNKEFFQAEVLAYIAANYSDTSYNSTTCSRDVGLIVDALSYDLAFGSNFASVKAGMSYYRAQSYVVVGREKEATLAAMTYLKTLVAATVSANSTAVTSVNTNMTTIISIITNGLGSVPSFVYPNPTNYNTSYLVGYGDARAQLVANKTFIVNEITEWIADQVAGPTAPFSGSFTYDVAACEADVGYIVDALIYDLTYGGNYQTLVAAGAYFTFGTPVYGTGEKDEVLAAYAHLKAVIGYVIDENTSWTKATALTQDTSGTAGSAGSKTFAQDRIQEIYDTINSDGTLPTAVNPSITWAPSGLQTAFATLQADKTRLQSYVINFVNETYAGFDFNTEVCSRDVGYIVDALHHDLTYGGNLATRQAASAYYSGTQLQIDSADKTATLAAYTYLKTLITSVAIDSVVASPVQSVVTQVRGTAGSGGAATAAGVLMDAIIDTIEDLVNLPAASNPGTTWVEADLVTKQAALQSARTTIRNAIITYIGTNYPNLVYDDTTCSRDVGLIIDAIGWDMVLNTNYQSVIAGRSYYRAAAAAVIGDQKRATLDAFRYLKGEIADVVSENTTALARVKKSMDIIINILDQGAGDTPQVTGTVTYNNTLAVANAVEILRANKTFLESEATAWISYYFGGTVVGTSSVGNTVETRLAHHLKVGDPVIFRFTPIDAVIVSVASTGNLVTLKSTAGMMAGQKFDVVIGTVGNLSAGDNYYIRSVVNGTQVTLSETFDGPVFDPGTATAVAEANVGDTVGGIVADTQYYVLTVPTLTSFTYGTTADATSPVTLSTEVGSIMVSYYYNETACRRDMGAYIDALIDDLNYTGNHASTYAARLYNNAIAGSELSDMFWVSNSTGLRNCTLSGLNGQLTDENSYSTKRPTAGAFVALNPGFGPYDSRVWVMTRSHYSQNVTMFGTGCTGAKIDSALHAGGNKSMVKNDFTTIISDGIGVWCTGADSLTELVSVFNYYGYAGYLAELGGRIRATNGNSSYGTYGVIAEGVSSKETPLYGTVDNAAYDAQITNTVTDGTTEVLRFEFGNAGQNYTNTSYTISGAGYNAAAIADEFRDASVFETRIIDLDDGNDYGGTGYVTASNAAQTGDLVSITIAATDTALTNAYNGMRIQVIGGTGVGQYGNILTYGGGSKIATVYKDSFTSLTATDTTSTGNYITVSSNATLYANMPIYITGTTFGGVTANTLYYVKALNGSTQFTISLTEGGTAETLSTASGTMTVLAAGWDHVIPGFDIENALDLTTSYIIEPKIGYTAPGYTATARTLASSTTWNKLTYGDNKYVAVPTTGTTTNYSADGVTWASAGALATSATWVDIAYGGGQGATATAVVGGLGGQGATFEAVLGVANTTGAATADQVASVTVIDGGQGYTTPPVILFSGTGTGAEAVAKVLDGKVVSIEVTVPGSGYTSAPTVTAATDRITHIVVDTHGIGYTSAPQITISGGGGTGGSAEAVMQVGYDGVPRIRLIDSNTLNEDNASYLGYSGTGYTSTPTVTIVDTGAKYIALAQGGENCYTTSAGIATATTWTAGTSTAATDNVGLAYGNGVYVAVGAASASSSTSGTSWTARTIPSLGAGSYSAVAYGNGTFVAISTGNNATAYSSNGTSWTAGGSLPSSTTWNSVAYGNGRFVAIAGSSRSVAISIDKGVSWAAVTPGLPTSTTWTRVAYGQGLFFAIASGGTTAATSPDGINWTVRAMPSSSDWSDIHFGNTSRNPLWVAISSTSGTTAASVRTGAQATGRVKVAGDIVTEIRMIEPGSGYPKGAVTATTATTNIITTGDTTNLVAGQPIEFTDCAAGGLLPNVTYYVTSGSIVTNTSFKVSTSVANATAGTAMALTTTTGLSGVYRAGPTATVTDPNDVIPVATRVRLGDGALGNPSFSDRGADNTTATADTSGDGYSDLYQASTFINVANLSEVPEAGANVEFASLPGLYFKLVTVTNVLEDIYGNYTATFQINPGLTVLQAPANGDLITTRLKYSQVRLTGHDFLYIGTGNYTTTNYPGTPLIAPNTARQQLYSAGGRVFFTSTDQDGNFNVGNLFGVQQATGTATLNASAFNLSGLNSLQLGSVELGIGSAVITQFSTDPYFTADSDNIVPTQRAIKAYITAQIGGGQSSLNVNTLTSGVVYVAGNSISTTTGVGLNVKSKMNFTGGIDGAPVALGFFMQR